MKDSKDSETVDAFPIKRGKGRPRNNKSIEQRKKENAERQAKHQKRKRDKAAAMKFALFAIKSAQLKDDLSAKCALDKFVYFLGGGDEGRADVHYNIGTTDKTEEISHSELVALIGAGVDVIRVY